MLWVWTLLRRDVLDTTLCDKVCQWLATGQWFSPGTRVSSTNKTDPPNITEILLKVALNTIKPTNQSKIFSEIKNTTQLQANSHFTLILGYELIVEDTTVKVKCTTVIKALFVYFNLCLSIMLDSLLYSFTSIYLCY